jgi:hypothetical protein
MAMQPPVPASRVELHLPWVANPASPVLLEQAKAQPNDVVEVLVWAAAAQVCSLDDRDISLFLVLQEIGQSAGDRRRELLAHVLDVVRRSHKVHIPVPALLQLVPSDHLQQALQTWRGSPADRPRFLVSKRTPSVRGLFPFDGPHFRKDFARQVDNLLARWAEDFYLQSSEREAVMTEIDELIFERGADALGRSLSPQHRVLALRLLLLDPRFPLVEDWGERLLPGARERPYGYIPGPDYPAIEAGLAPIVATIGALYASPQVWQPTEICAYTLDLATAILEEPVGEIRGRRDLGDSVADLLSASGATDVSEPDRRKQVAATLLSLVARQVVVTPQTALMDWRGRGDP